MISPDQIKDVVNELNEKVLFSIFIESLDVEVYITKIEVVGGLNVEFFTKYPEKESLFRPYVEQCITKLIEDEQKQDKLSCKSNGVFSRILSAIKNIFQ